VGITPKIRGLRCKELRQVTSNMGYQLACIDNSWFLVAFCHLHGEIRMFAPARIRHLEPTGRTFDPPTDFRIDDYLARSFAVLRGTEGELYRVRLSGSFHK
jgi:predicted DNA-binding transcriptional regulator YafY